MNRISRSDSGLFLMEIMVVIFFFILCSATCIMAFVRADYISRIAADRNRAVGAAESIVEIWKAEGSEGLEKRLYAKRVENGWEIRWDRNWRPQNGETSAYQASLYQECMDGLCQIEVKIKRKDGNDLFSLRAKRLEGA